jgi:hypothetical protein
VALVVKNSQPQLNPTTPPPPKVIEVPEDDWREAKTPDGKIYYYNLKTNEKSWGRPPQIPPPPPDGSFISHVLFFFSFLLFLCFSLMVSNSLFFASNVQNHYLLIGPLHLPKMDSCISTIERRKKPCGTIR